MQLQFITYTKRVWKEASKGKIQEEHYLSSTVKALCHPHAAILQNPSQTTFPVKFYLTTSPPQMRFDHTFLCSMPFHTSYITQITLYCKYLLM